MTRNVFECINWTRQEHLVALTGLESGPFWDAFRAAPPAEAAHWDFAVDKIVLECVGRAMPERDASAFIERYAAALRIPGWKVLCVREG